MRKARRNAVRPRGSRVLRCRAIKGASREAIVPGAGLNGGACIAAGGGDMIFVLVLGEARWGTG